MSRQWAVLAASVVAMLVAPSAAWAQNYSISIGGGPGKTSDTNDGRAGDEDPSAHKTGFTGSIALGYALQPELRAEAEYGYIHAPVKSDGDVPLGGKLQGHLFMANLRYEPKLAIPEPFKVYLGGGLGWARVLHADEFINFFGEKKTSHQWRGAFAYQLRAGVGYAINPSTDLTVGYRYVHINSGSVDQQQGSSLVRVNFDTIQNHSLELGVAWRF